MCEVIAQNFALNSVLSELSAIVIKYEMFWEAEIKVE